MDSGSKASDFLTQHQDISGKVNKVEIADVEAGSTASRSYAVGEILWRNGIAYQAITAIASGDAFSENNISVVQNGIANSLTQQTRAVAGDLADVSGDLSDLTTEVGTLGGARRRGGHDGQPRGADAGPPCDQLGADGGIAFRSAGDDRNHRKRGRVYHRGH